MPEESLDQKRNRITREFSRLYNPPTAGDAPTSPQVWVVEIFDTHLIVSERETFYRLAYTDGETGLTFAPRGEWQAVEPVQGWVDAVKALEAAQHGNALKAISRTDDELRVGNYIVLFGGRDLEGYRVGAKSPLYRNADGTQGNFFTKNTEFESPYTAIGRLPEDWEHGLQPAEIERDEVLGYVDWSTKRVDERGIFVERVLNRRNRYVKWLEELIAAGIVGSSSECVHGKGRVKTTGEITHWPLMRDTLTVQPAEPRMLGENVVAAMKALGLDPSRGQPGQAAPDGAPATPVTEPVVPATERQNPMPPETPTPPAEGDVKALSTALEALTTEVKSLQTQMKAQPQLLPGTQIVPVKDEYFKSLGEQLSAVIRAEVQPTYADPRLAKYNAKRIDELKATGMHEGGLAEGGAFVQTEFSNTLMERVYDGGKVLARVQDQPIGAAANAYSMLLLKETSRATGSRYGGIRVYRVGEGGTITGSRPEFDRKEVRPFKLAALCDLTDELVQDATALEGHVRRLFPLEARYVMENELFRGTGAGQTTGILNAPATISIAKETGQAAATIVYQNLLKMWARLWGGSEANAVWYANKDTFEQWMLLYQAVGTSGIPARGITFEGGKFTAFGAPVEWAEYCSTLGTVGDVVLADYSQYLGVSKGQMRSDSSIHVRFVTDETTLRFVWRWAAEPTWRSALTPANGSNTQSPFLTLATRS